MKREVNGGELWASGIGSGNYFVKNFTSAWVSSSANIIAIVLSGRSGARIFGNRVMTAQQQKLFAAARGYGLDKFQLRPLRTEFLQLLRSLLCVFRTRQHELRIPADILHVRRVFVGRAEVEDRGRPTWVEQHQSRLRSSGRDFGNRCVDLDG